MFQERLIEFSHEKADWLIPPLPTKKIVPEWFKKIPNYYDLGNKYDYQTVKKCMPFLDTLTSGYIIFNEADIAFWENTEGAVNWSYNKDVLGIVDKLRIGINTHSIPQYSDKMYYANEYEFGFKYVNPWTIKTPKNYSCLFTNPFNSEEREIRILDGIVDTDEYDSPVNFPFFLKKIKNPHEPFILKKGTPIALVFPFQRDSWKMKVKKTTKKEKEKSEINFWKIFGTMTDSYKKYNWKKKNYD